MSSANRPEIGTGKGMSEIAGDREMGPTAGKLSPRQIRLNRLWAHYKCAQYAQRKLDWDGRECLDPMAHDAVSSQGFIPPGFYSAAVEDVPLKFRKPTAPYHLAKVIVDRFTALLFAEARHPNIRVEGDPATEDFARALSEQSRLWATCIKARTHGGSMGTCIVGFQFIDGKAVVEVHDPRWCRPQFKNRAQLTLKNIEKRYQYPVEEVDDDGDVEEVMYWYRRTIDEHRDVVYKPCRVDAGVPFWEVDHEAVHDFGFCPVVWVQNLPSDDDVDGEPDAAGCFDSFDAIDSLVAQANRAVIANCDPTVVIVTEAAMDEVVKGTGNAIKLPSGSASYMEITGSGPAAALKLADEMRTRSLEVAQVVLDTPVSANETTVGVERAYSSMLAKGDMLREQYGQHLVTELMNMMLKAAKDLSERVEQDVDGTLVRHELVLPPRVVPTGPDTSPLLVPRKIGKITEISLTWPGYFEPTLADVTAAANAAGVAKQAGLLDDEHAVAFVAPYFQVDDPSAMLKAIRDAGASKDKDMEAMFGADPRGM